MGFCMATSGLTQGGQVVELAEQQMNDPSEDLEPPDMIESMDADEDPEVLCSY